MRNGLSVGFTGPQILLFLLATGLALPVWPYDVWRNPDLYTPERTDPFRVPPGLVDAVGFWRQVFGVWSRRQVVLHDSEHLDLVYEVLDLPGAVGQTQTPAQRAFVEYQRLQLARDLDYLEKQVHQGPSLTAEQQRLLTLITQAAGKWAISGAGHRVRAQRGMRERFLEGLQISGRYDTVIRKVFQRAGLPEDLAYLPHVESSFMNHARSSAGAVGIWQFTAPAGRRFLQMNPAVDERYDPILAAQGAARYLAHAYGELGDWGLAVTSYNHGIGGMVRAKREFGPDIERIVRSYRGPVFGFASRNFYAEFLAVRTLLGDLKTHFPLRVRLDRPLRCDRIRLKRELAVPHLAAVYGVEADVLVDLNPAWTSKAVRGRIRLPAGTEVWLPPGQTLSGRRAEGLAYVEEVAEAGDPNLASVYTRSLGDVALGSSTDEDPTTGDAPALADGFIRVGYGSEESANRATLTLSNSSTPKKPAWKRQFRPQKSVHVVKRGETPRLIAARYGVSVAKLFKLNSLKRGSAIRPGQRLRISNQLRHSVKKINLGNA